MANVAKPDCRACVAAGLFAVLVIFSWTTLRVHVRFENNWTGLFYSGKNFPLPPELAATTYRAPATGYDGQFYRELAHDPFLTKGYFRYVDSPRMRFRRCLVSLLAFLAAFGDQQLIDYAYIGVEMFFLGLGVYWCARWFARRNVSPWWGLLFVVVPATLASFDRMLLDGPVTALFAGFCLYCDEKRWLRAGLIAALAALTRETGLLLIVALVVERLWARDVRRAAWFSLSAVPALAWFSYVASVVPPDGDTGAFGIPVVGLFRRLFLFTSAPGFIARVRLDVTGFLAIAGLIVSIAIAMRWIALRWIAERHPGVVTICVGLFAFLALFLDSEAHLVEAFGFGRPISPMLLWIMMEAVPAGMWGALIPPLLISLSIILTFRWR